MLLRATLVGCNYAGSEYELHGCINDVSQMRRTLINRFHFPEDNIFVLTDDNNDDKKRPTGANIMRALRRMASAASSAGEGGAMLLFHFSGHGTVLSGGPYVRHEAIVPCDLNLITDVDLKWLVVGLPEGATFTMVSDSCHTGGLIAQGKEQMGRPTEDDDAADAVRTGTRRTRTRTRTPTPTTPTPTPTPTPTRTRTRFIPWETVMEKLGVTDVQHLKERMHARFGDDKSALFRDPSDPWVPVPRPGSGILLSGCQSDEASADGEVYGAFTIALLVPLREEHPREPMTNSYVVRRAREVMRLRQWREFRQQHPCLYCCDDNVNALFLGGFP